MPPVITAYLPGLELFDAVLCAAGVVGLLSILTPIVASGLRLYRIRFTAVENPCLAEPDGTDFGHAWRHAELVRMGFRSLGRIDESVYLYQHEWVRNYRSKILISADGRTFAGLYRLSPGGILRVAFTTVVGGDCLVRTAMPGAGLEVREPDYYRLESPRQPMAGLYARHLKTVDAFTAEYGGVVTPVTLAELADVDERAETWLAGIFGLGNAKWYPVWGWVVPFLIAVTVLNTFTDWTLPRRIGVAAVLAACAYWVLTGPVLRAWLNCAQATGGAGQGSRTMNR